MVMEILALSGSLRAQSTNSRLLRAAAALAPATMRFTHYDAQMAELPQFNPDLDTEGAVPHPAVATMRALLGRAHALFICCPEYAAGVPGSFKNLIDWTVSSGELGEKPIALLMASPTGAPNAHAALVPTLRFLNARLVFDASVLVTTRPFDAEGRIADEGLRRAVLEALARIATIDADPV